MNQKRYQVFGMDLDGEGPVHAVLHGPDSVRLEVEYKSQLYVAAQDRLRKHLGYSGAIPRAALLQFLPFYAGALLDLDSPRMIASALRQHVDKSWSLFRRTIKLLAKEPLGMQEATIRGLLGPDNGFCYVGELCENGHVTKDLCPKCGQPMCPICGCHCHIH